ncbi:D-2-hydroxyglutarate dehydrogenase [Capsaspora owczarzaki ATCC 30864]|uniref:D-2-hydroxyglutarate dehydrogenase n=1 Tax=Capsaspora owczarzaki (strain ATCC 30864) TaxID=595528 RepID=A0A0D2UPT6_CAPO3|nr:D-2-hydroxyglutarate dehydrogenase [Capsaspora owczarzaki ATCC 30864]KJE97011.1 D-2-hydroxyglutarate dehydrogenase [Capsaspora owczarzaki ATCC 30864]|eukprot:XP_004343373.2 D-2-hydroxyglutarate dehydrogenase [Capsaspora owczarzaki ATCC 30864]
MLSVGRISLCRSFQAPSTRPVLAAVARAFSSSAQSTATGSMPIALSPAQPPLTSTSHPHVHRSAAFARLDPAVHLPELTQLVGGPAGVAPQDAMDFHNTDWQGRYRGASSLALLPSTPQQVAAVLKYCSDHQLAVVPQGGNTGLVGGSVPVFDEIVVSTARMNKIRSFNAVTGVLECDAGCVLETLDNYLLPRNHTMPWDLGAKGSCHIGGNVATNAGGLRLLRYGSLHGSILGLEVALTDGSILDTMSSLRKDNTGYDLKQLFIGSEGTLGVITGVSVLTAAKPKSVHVLYIGCESFATVQTIFSEAKQRLGEILSACEFQDAPSLNLVLQYIPNTRNPLSASHPFYVLIETSGSNETHDLEKLDSFVEFLYDNKISSDAVASQDISQVKAIWQLRENVASAMKRQGEVWKYDLSLPISQMYPLVEELRTRLPREPGVLAVGYGHLGDGNVHINVVAPTRSESVHNAIEPFIYEWTQKHRGSVSAEHGLGFTKAHCIGYSKPPRAISLMHNIRSLFDPKGILNPYKVLPHD